MKTITLQTAVMLALETFSAMRGAFSAYEITQYIRQKVDSDYVLSDGDYVDEYDEDEDEDVIYTDISHEKVRKLVTELYDNGLFAATKTIGKNPTTQASFILYTPVDRTVATVSKPANPTTPDYITKVDAYLATKGSATVKQIQSALKLKGVTCDDILKAISDYSGVSSTLYTSDTPSKVLIKW